MRRIRLRVAYDGTAYCGWQVQPEVPTIEGELNQAISRLTKEEIIVIGASRTDAGVHAKGNVAVFDTESTIPADRFAYALNPLLPEDIVVVASDDVAADWHPRHCDTEKTYEYKILNSKFPDPMRRRDTYHVSDFVDRSAQGFTVQDSDKQFIIDFYKYALVGMALEWIRRDMKEDPVRMTERLNVLLHGELERALRRFRTDRSPADFDD